MNTMHTTMTAWMGETGPLAKRLLRRYSVLALAALAFYAAGAHFNSRHESLQPKTITTPMDLDALIKTGDDIPVEANAANVYLRIEEHLSEMDDFKKVSGQSPLILAHLVEQDEIKDDRLAELSAWVDATDSLAGQLRTETAGMRECLFSYRFRYYESGRYTYYFNAPSLSGWMGSRAVVAAHRGDTARWQAAMEDMLRYTERLDRDHIPLTMKENRLMTGAMLAGLAAGCRSGVARDGAFLDAFSMRVKQMQPLRAVEPLVAYAIAQGESCGYLGWNLYSDHILSKSMYFEYRGADWLQAPSYITGFSARDKTLFTGYLNTLVERLRGGQPHAAFQWITENAIRLEQDSLWRAGELLSPSHSALVYTTAEAGNYRNTPVNAFLAEGNLRLLRAGLSLMQTALQTGAFPAADSPEASALGKELPNPFNGGEMRITKKGNQLSLLYPIDRPVWRGMRGWGGNFAGVLLRLTLPEAAS